MKTILAWLSAGAIAAQAWRPLPCPAQVPVPATRGGNPPVTITGTVTGPSGAPAAGVHITTLPLVGAANPDVQTDDQGRYSYAWTPPALGGNRTVTFSVLARDPSNNLAAIAAIDEQTTQMDLRLAAGLKLSGSVEDGVGQPVADVSIQLFAYNGNLGLPIERQPIRVPADGTFEISALPQGLRYVITARAAGRGTANQTLNSADTATDSLKLSPLILKVADRLVAGKVLDQDGHAVSGAQVQAAGPNQPTGVATTDADGRFEFKVVEGQVQLIVFKGNPASVVQAQSGDENVVIRLTATVPPVVRGSTTANRASTGLIGTSSNPLPPPGFWDPLIAWLREHKPLVRGLAIAQMLVLASVSGAVFWITSRRRA